ncbi:hypothetical protein ACS0TY_011036 [Phlomoides rotata]
MENFLIMDMPSSYTVVFGRPILNLFQVVISTHHMKMKSPVRDEVGEVKGADKVVAQELGRVRGDDPELKKPRVIEDLEEESRM